MPIRPKSTPFLRMREAYREYSGWLGVEGVMAMEAQQKLKRQMELAICWAEGHDFEQYPDQAPPHRCHRCGTDHVDAALEPEVRGDLYGTAAYGQTVLGDADRGVVERAIEQLQRRANKTGWDEVANECTELAGALEAMLARRDED